MAAGNIRWYAQFKDILDNDILINIHDTLYSGDGTEVDIATDPALITWLTSGDDKYTNIKATEVKITFISSTSLQYYDVFAYGNTRFICTIYKNSNLYWRGYASPEGYNEPFRFAPYPTTMTFIDGIAMLKNIEFQPPGFAETDWNQSVIWYIKAALNEINHQIPIYCAVDLDFTSSGAGSVTSRILEAMYIDWRSIRNEDGTFWTWYDVLNNILKTLQARIYMNNGVWVVENVDQKKDTYRVEKYLYTGIYDSTETAQDDVISMTGITPPVMRFLATADLEITPGMRTLKTAQDYGHRTNLLKFNNFYGNFFADEFTPSGLPRYWNTNGSSTCEFDEAENALLINTFIEPVPTPTDDYVYNDEADLALIEPSFYQTMIEDWFKGKLTLKVKYKLKLKIDGDLSLITNAVANVFFVMECGGTEYRISYNPYTSTDPWEWGTAGTEFIVTYFTYENISEWVNIEFSLSPPAAESGLTHSNYSFFLGFEDLNISATDPDIGFAEGDGYLVKGIQVYFDKMTEKYVDSPKYVHDKKFSGTFRGRAETSENGMKQSMSTSEADQNYQREEEYTMNDENMTSPDDYLVNFGDTPNYNGSLVTGGQVAMNRYIFKDSAGYPINYFSCHGDGRQESLIFFINRSNFANTYRESQIKLRGTLIDQTDELSFQSVMEDFDGRKYIPISMTENIKYRTFESEWHCIDPGAGTGEFSDDFNEDFFI